MLRCSGKVLQKTFVVFTLSMLGLILDGRSALSARPDAISASTLGGPDVITQSILIRDHVPAPMASQDRMFKRRRSRTGELETRPDESSGFAWEMGYAFSWPAVPSSSGTTTSKGNMSSHSGLLGMDLEISPNWAVAAVVQGDIIPDKSYGHGRLGLRVEAFVPLFSVPQEPLPEMPRLGSADQTEDPEDRLDPVEKVVAPTGGNAAPLVRVDEERDARTYYFRHRKRRLEVPEDLRYRGRYRKKEDRDAPAATASDNSAPLVPAPSQQATDSPYPYYDDDEEPPPEAPKSPPPEQIFPHMTVALLLAFDQHVRDLGANLSITSPLSSGEAMSQVSVGGEVAFLLDGSMKFYAAGTFSSYSQKISTFLTGLPSAPAASFIMPSSLVSAFQPHFLAFPGFLFEEGATIAIDDTWTLGLALNQVIYAASGSGLGLGFAPAVTYAISREWSLGLGAGIGVGGPSSGTVLGLLNVGYLF